MKRYRLGMLFAAVLLTGAVLGSCGTSSAEPAEPPVSGVIGDSGPEEEEPSFDPSRAEPARNWPTATEPYLRESIS